MVSPKCMFTIGVMESAPTVILGGTFDPPHVAHLVAAEVACHQFQTDNVVFLPAGQPPLKETALSSPEHRTEMLRIAIARTPGSLIDKRELRRQGPSFTSLTIREYRVEFPESRLVFVIGCDQLTKLSQWHDIEYLVENISFAIAPRPPHRMNESLKAAQREFPDATFIPLDMPELAISSTLIRTRIEEDRPVRHLLPDAVLSYANKHALYASKIDPAANARRQA